MGKALVIVESPAKAKTINKYLGSDYAGEIQRRSHPRFADQWLSCQKECRLDLHQDG